MKLTICVTLLLVVLSCLYVSAQDRPECNIYISNLNINGSVGCGSSWSQPCNTLEQGILSCDALNVTQIMNFYFYEGTYVLTNHTMSIYNQMVFVYGSPNATTTFDFKQMSDPVLEITEDEGTNDDRTQFFLYNATVVNLNAPLVKAVTMNSDCSIEVNGCSFVNNKPGNESLFYLVSGDVTTGIFPNWISLMIIDSIFSSTYGTNELGGSIFHGVHVNSGIENSEFKDNSASGNLVYTQNGDLNIRGSIFSQNILIASQDTTPKALVQVVNQTSTSQIFENNTFILNSNNQLSAPYVSVYIFSNSTANITDSLFTQNSMNAIYAVNNGSINVINCEFTFSPGFPTLYTSTSNNLTVTQSNFTANNIADPITSEPIIQAYQLANLDVTSCQVTANNGYFLITSNAHTYFSALVIENNQNFTLVQCEQQSEIILDADLTISNNTMNNNDDFISCQEDSCDITSVRLDQYSCNATPDDTDKKKGLSNGAKAAIIICVIGFVVLVTVIVIILVKRSHHRHHYHSIDNHH
ncbi:hypothetical protein DLAC_02986 [Tieghemostelium lacteum]|uniref:Transmembrane protein n=1 Tax=Tieghemostelium lacteum TaxID=361077 RepID=A0A152A3S9_TIELA|nr:hypothetical protein DLAC_02986 [Tieghemostelium lacteum]|eukprot:KYR00922.1 hypothetical protein DLAC_02986 [Tieghemostelium lacteum]